MHIHILGICGTFMGSLALLARELGVEVSGVDENVYPPMSTQLQQANVCLLEGYDNHGLDKLIEVDTVIIGNALSRGNPAVEYTLSNRLHYQSGPQWIAENVLSGKRVLAVAGTHGKTTTSSMLAWILQYAGMEPGFLIGGVPENFGCSARLGGGKYFVIEADEYDSAFFDKRSKFVHYCPQILAINNLEFDHADIFDDLAAIQRQFHHLLRTVPADGAVIFPDERNIADVIKQGIWSRKIYLNGERAHWQLQLVKADGSAFDILCKTATPSTVRVDWSLCGEHNAQNALAAMVAANEVGVAPDISASALSAFACVKRRMELIASIRGIDIYDDFAHHPTAIEKTLAGAKKRYRDGRILAVIEPRSNTMRMQVHHDRLAKAVSDADYCWWCETTSVAGLNTGNQQSALEALFSEVANVSVLKNHSQLIEQLCRKAQPGDAIVIMSNGSFGGIHNQIVKALDKFDLK